MTRRCGRPAVAVMLAALAACGSGGGSGRQSATTRSSAGTGAPALGVGGPGGHEVEESERWSAEAAVAERPLATAVPTLARSVSAWRDGSRTLDEHRLELDRDLAALLAGRDALGGLRPFPFAAGVTDLYRRSALLDVEAARVQQVAAALLPGAPQDQGVLLGKRLLELADRTFDRGQALVEPHLRRPTSTGLVVVLPEEVPDWVAEGFAAGPPLDEQPPGAATTPSVHQPDRPAQPRSGWLAAVDHAALPGAAEIAAALARPGDDGRLRTLARALVAAAERLRTTPDPAGDREGATRLRLGLLVEADALRATQLASLVAGPTGASADGPDHSDVAALGGRLRRSTGRLLAVAAGLWPDDVTVRPAPGEPAALADPGLG